MLVNTLGHIAGVAVFGAFLHLLWRSRQRSPQPGFALPAWAGVLALSWNLGALVMLSQEAAGRPAPLVESLSFMALSLLPAILLHQSLRPRLPRVTQAGYGVSVAACIVHLMELAGVPDGSHDLGLLTITAGFGGLTLLAAVLLGRNRLRERGQWARLMAAMAVFLFAASFVHFGAEHEERTGWLHEIFFHHAGIPLALLILLQDYRFLLLDVYARMLSNGLLAAAAAGVLIWIWGPDSLLARGNAAGGFEQALAIAAVCAILLTFASLRGLLQRWLSRAIFRRGEVRLALDAIDRQAEAAENESGLLARSAPEIARFVRAARWNLVSEQELAGAPTSPPRKSKLLARSAALDALAPWAEVAVPFAFPSGGGQALLLGRREAARRYLSEDLADLDRLAGAIVDHVERLRRRELQRLVSEAELQALRAQINPHFLFNALNALYGVIPRSAERARRTLLNLAEVFRYTLQGERPYVTLEEEMRIVNAYLDIEKLRLGGRLRCEIDIEPAALSLQMPPLSIQPLVENAVKHGVSQKPKGGLVRVSVRLQGETLRVEVFDDGPGFGGSRRQGMGRGLENVRRRLELSFSGSPPLTIDSNVAGTVAAFEVKASAVRSNLAHSR